MRNNLHTEIDLRAGARPAGIPSQGSWEDSRSLSVTGLLNALGAVRRKWWAMLVLIALCGGAAFLVAVRQDAVYEAETQLLMQRRGIENLLNPVSVRQVDAERAIQTEIEIIESPIVRDLVNARTAADAPANARAIGETDIVAITVRAETPEIAAELANAYAETYIQLKRDQSLDDYERGSLSLETRLNEIERELTALEPSPESDALRAGLLDQQASYMALRDQLQVNASLTSGGAQIVGIATEPTSLLVGLVIGGLLGLGLAMLLDQLDDTIKGRVDLDNVARGIEVLGGIPTLKSSGASALTRADSRESEAFRHLRTSLQFAGSLNGELGVIQVTSASQSDGKSTVLSNLALSLAQLGQRVIVVDLDLRRPRQHELLGGDRRRGVSSHIVHGVPLESVVLKSPAHPNLFVLPGGPATPHPAEVLYSDRTARMIEALRERFDIVLVDTPPLLPVTDPQIVARLVDAVVLVVSMGKTRTRMVSRALDLLRQVDAPLAGIVLNRAEIGGGGYGYGYGYGYGHEPETKRIWSRGRSSDSELTSTGSLPN
jgi:polysaccharide biosynthesis transport protein